MVNKESLKCLFSDHLKINSDSLIDQSLVNFIEDGNLTSKIPGTNSGLAIDELCPNIRAHLNF